MSSILKALKKAEEGRPEARDTESWSHHFDSGEAIRRQARRSWWLRATTVVVCLVVILVAGGWLLHGQGHLLKESAFRLVKMSSKPERPGQVAAPVRAEEETAVVHGVLSEQHSPPSAPKAAPAESSSPPSGSAGMSVTAARESVPSGRPAKTFSSAAVESSGTLDTGRFRLEAIVWSDNPKSTFAVINGNIVRVGESIGDASITAIDRESVQVRSGDRTGELRFTHD